MSCPRALLWACGRGGRTALLRGVRRNLRPHLPAWFRVRESIGSTPGGACRHLEGSGNRGGESASAACLFFQLRPRAIVLSMIPFAVSGPIVIGVVVAVALLLVVLLLRGDDRYQAEQERARERERNR